jgi:hypothetical protein
LCGESTLHLRVTDQVVDAWISNLRKSPRRLRTPARWVKTAGLCVTSEMAVIGSRAARRRRRQLRNKQAPQSSGSRTRPANGLTCDVVEALSSSRQYADIDSIEQLEVMQEELTGITPYLRLQALLFTISKQ